MKTAEASVSGFIKLTIPANTNFIQFNRGHPTRSAQQGA